MIIESKKIAGYVSLFFLIVVFFQNAIALLMGVDSRDVNSKSFSGTLITWFIIIFISGVIYFKDSYTDMDGLGIIASIIILLTAILGIAYNALMLDILLNPFDFDINDVKSSVRLQIITTFLAFISGSTLGFSMGKDN